MLCEPHGERFLLGRACPKCRPGAPDRPKAPEGDISFEVAPPPGCVTFAEHEAALCELARNASAAALRKGGKGRGTQERQNWTEIAIKAHRAAAELARQREKDQQLPEMLKRKQKQTAQARGGVRH